MTFVEDEQKRKMREIEEQAAIQQKRKARQKKIILWLSVIVLAGLAVVAYDLYQRASVEDLFPDDPQARRELVEAWTRAGLIYHLDVAARVCDVDEARWSAYGEDEMREIALTLAFYCKEQLNAETPEVTIRSSTTRKELARLVDTELELY